MESVEEDENPNDSFDIALSKFEIPNETSVKQNLNKISVNSASSSGDVIQASNSFASTSSTITNPKNIIKDTTYTILVNPKQRGNPILKSITNVPWEYDEIIPDYIVGRTTCILYLSLRYHNLNPDYIHDRLKSLKKMFELRILLVQVDTKDPYNALKHLTRLCFLADLTLMLAWNAEEAGKIIETYKQFENKPPDLIMERTEQYPHQKLVGALTGIKPVNKTDAMTLLQNFGSLANIINSSEDRIAQCPGLGPRKAKKLYKTFNDSFLAG